MGAKWEIIRETYPLTELPLLSAATGGASDTWHFVEPSLAEVNAATAEEGEVDSTIGTLVEACTRDADGEPVFGEGRFRDLPSRAASELAKFALDKFAPPAPEEDADGGKPPGSASTS